MWRLKLAVVVLGILVAGAVPASADSISYTFTNMATGDLGSTYTFTSTSSQGQSIGITAYGFRGVPNEKSTEDLYGKVTTGNINQTGLGTLDGYSHEISGAYWIQLDVGQLLAGGFNNEGYLTFSSVQKSDTFDIWGSNTLGSQGVLLFTGTYTSNLAMVDIPSWGQFRYVGISAPKSSVLLFRELQCGPVPEPATLVLFGTGLLSLGGLVRKRLRR